MSRQCKRPTLYRMFDDSGRLLYVGCTDLFMQRMTGHAGEKSWWTDVTTVHVEHFPTRASAFVAEAEAIAVERPMHNVQVPRADILRHQVRSGRGSQPSSPYVGIESGPLASALLRAGIDSVESLATRAGLSRATTYRAMRNPETVVSLKTVCKLGGALDLSPEAMRELIEAEREFVQNDRLGRVA